MKISTHPLSVSNRYRNIEIGSPVTSSLNKTTSKYHHQIVADFKPLSFHASTNIIDPDATISKVRFCKTTKNYIGIYKPKRSLGTNKKSLQVELIGDNLSKQCWRLT